MLLKSLLLCLFFKFSISTDTISLNESITDNNIIVSKKGNFALGFFSPSKSRYRYLGIWYHKLPEQTVVWVANRENPINGSSAFLSMNPDGNLALYTSHDQRLPLWSTNISVKAREDCFVQLQDSGDLVLYEKESKRILWQSFDYPTDTMLPTMKLGLDRKLGLERKLTSWRSPDNPGNGDWSYKLVPTGCPQFMLLYKGLTRYWRSSPWPWDGVPIPGYIRDSANNQDEIYYTFVLDDESSPSRVIATSSGLIQRLTWDHSSLQWRVSRSDPKYKYGHCGAYSLLNSNNVDSLECMCLPGYKPKSLKNWYLRDGSAGCIKETTSSMCRNGEGFLKIEKVKIPDTSISALMNTNFSAGECKQLCLSNCACKAFANLDINRKGIGCVTWYGELMDTMQYSEGRDLYVHVDAIELTEYEKKKRVFLKKKGMLAILILSTALTMFLIGLFTYWLLRKKRTTKVKKKGLFSALMENELVESMLPSDLPIFDLCSISLATSNFNPANKIGQGGFGSVYKGQLQDGQEIAVKRLSKSSGQGLAEFKNELLLIARLQHRNHVRLLGCCIQEQEQMLIYEYLPNKSLDYCIFDHRTPVLDWRKRFDIIVGIARGVMYLHHDSRLRIVHRDLKTSNVLLDADMNPKISDFGMARIFKENEVQDKTNRIVGTYGYMAPEYAIFGKFSIKSDVFSFGVMMLEIISGKKNNASCSDDLSLHLIGRVWDLWKEDRVLDIIDSSLKQLYAADHEVMRCIQIGLLCVQENATDRPTMPTVVLMLNGETTLPTPKQPAFISARNNNIPNPIAAGVSSINEVTISEIKAR